MWSGIYDKMSDYNCSGCQYFIKINSNIMYVLYYRIFFFHFTLKKTQVIVALKALLNGILGLQIE